ncbi:MAG: hypothetical protein H7Y88_06695 [Phycisphaerales bacterium]|nr:hypothetical protein [Phycisphaerales bacterium]
MLARVLAMWGVLALGSAGAAVAEPPTETPTDEGAGARVLKEAPLAGPSAATLTRSKSGLVAIGFKGEVQRLELPIEEEALKLLRLDDGVRSRIEKILAERAVLLEHFVAENVDLLVKLDTTKDGLGKAALLAETLTKLRPVLEKGSLYEVIRGALPAAADERAAGGAASNAGDMRAGGMSAGGAQREGESARAAFERIVIEYRHAIASENQRKDKLGAVLAEKGESFGREIARAFERLEQSGELGYRYLLGDLGLSEAQEARFRGMHAEFMDRIGDSPSEKEQGMFFLSVLAWLSPEQQVKVVKKAIGSGR